MSKAKVWVNPSFQEPSRSKGVQASKRNRMKKVRQIKGKKANQYQRESFSQAAQSPIGKEQPPSLLEAISHFSKHIDLGKIKNQVTEVNQIMNQVSGVIQQLQSLNPQGSYRHYHQPYPDVTGQRIPPAPANPGYQHMSSSGHKR